MTRPTLLWWALLSCVALLNMVMWAFSARSFQRRSGALDPSIRTTRRWILWLAAGYVLGCAFRSFLPMIDAPRICLSATPLSRIVFGRSVATVAELCFAAQFALLLGEASLANPRGFVAHVARWLLPVIAIGEIFSWSAILTTNYLFHAIENSLWAFAAAAAVIAFASGWSATDARGRRFIAAVFLFGATYVAFMVLVDVPMYLSRWHAALAAGRTPLVALDGLREIVAHCRVVHEWSVWREDVAWLSLYFSTAVWLSIFLVHAPALTQMRGDTSVAAPAG